MICEYTGEFGNAGTATAAAVDPEEEEDVVEGEE